jgi:hypothetical protein
VPAIETAVIEALTENDPSQCTTIVTQRFVEQSFAEAGPEAIEECREANVDAKSTTAEEVTFDRVTVEGDTAQAVVAVSGGAEDGSILTISLLHEGGRWKLDHLDDIQINRARFDRAQEAAGVKEGLTPQEAQCVVAQLRRTHTTAQLEQEALDEDTEDPASPEVLCLSRATLVREFAKGIRRSVQQDKQDIPEQVAECVVHKLTRDLRITQLRALVAAGDVGRPALSGLARTATRNCAHDYRLGILGATPPT